MAIDLTNQSHKKFTFEIIYEDSHGDPKTAVTALQKLLSETSLPAIIGENISSSTLAMIPLIDKAQKVLISPSASSPKLSGSSQYFFRVFPSDVEEGFFMTGIISKAIPGAKVCILFMNNDFGVGLKEVFEKNAESKGLQVLETFGYDKSINDFRTVLTRVKQLKPDAIYLAGYYQDGGAILRQAKQLGINSTFWGSTTHEDPQLLTIAGDAAEGFRYPVSTGFDPNSPDSVIQKFVEDFRTKYKKEPGLVSALGYDCAKLITDAIVTTGGAVPDQIRSFLANTKDYRGATGRMTFDNRGDVHKTIVLKTVQNQEFIFARQ